MKAKRILAISLAAPSLCMLAGFIGMVLHSTSRASVPPALVAPAVVSSVTPTGNVLGNSSAIFAVSAGSGGTYGTESTIYNFGTNSLTTYSGSGGAIYAVNGGTGSISCSNAYLSLTLTGTPTNILIGSSSSSCTYPVFATGGSGSIVTAGTGTSTTISLPVAVQSIQLPQLTNVNQLYMKLTSSSSATADVELFYNQ